MKGYIAIVFVFLFSLSQLTAQTFEIEDPEVTRVLGVRQNPAVNDFLVNQTGSNAAEPGQNNLVIIDQIGSGNTSVINTQAESSLVNVLQNGENNNLFLNVRANQIRESVNQQGSNHNFTDFSSGGRIHNLEVVQSGNNQNLIFYGGNSISENMKINMQGTTQSLVIRNFN